MNVWGFREWRKGMGYTQVEAGAKLGFSRAAVQYWEGEIRPAVELACRELLRNSKQRPEFGPVPLLYADEPTGQQVSPCSSALLLKSEPHPNNESALSRLVWLRETMSLFMALIAEDDGNVIWSGPELLHECDARKKRQRRAKRIRSNALSLK